VWLTSPSAASQGSLSRRRHTPINGSEGLLQVCCRAVPLWAAISAECS
jgi:hypothetical protein